MIRPSSSLTLGTFLFTFAISLAETTEPGPSPELVFVRFRELQNVPYAEFSLANVTPGVIRYLGQDPDRARYQIEIRSGRKWHDAGPVACDLSGWRQFEIRPGRSASILVDLRDVPASFRVVMRTQLSDGAWSEIRSRTVLLPSEYRGRASRVSTLVDEETTPPVPLLRKAPKYPDIAARARLEGTVVLDVRVGIDGEVNSLRILKSAPVFDSAALESVRQWTYKPARRRGVPVEVTITETVTFQLNEKPR